VTDAYRQVIQVLGRCRRVLVTTHVRPDGDALGTVTATVLAMRRMGIESEALLLSRLPPKYAFVFEDNRITHHDAERSWPAAVQPNRFDALLVMDTGTWSQLPGLRERVAAWAMPKLVVDHHLTQEDWADVSLVVKDVAGRTVRELQPSTDAGYHRFTWQSDLPGRGGRGSHRRARACLRTSQHQSGDRCHRSCPSHLSACTCRPT